MSVSHLPPRDKTIPSAMFLLHHLVYPFLLACLLSFLYRLVPSDIKAKLCPVVMCTLPIIGCFREPECKRMLDCFVRCEDKDSDLRRQVKSKYKHLQFPQDPALCSYECIGLITTQTAEELVECTGNRKCLQPSKYSDQCAVIRQDQVLELSAIPKNVLEGRWRKIFTNGWDIWPYQTTSFSGPGGKAIETREWMTAWPNSTDVWRMDLSWAFQSGENAHRFNMSSELFPGLRWDYPGMPKANPTLRTVAKMWGTTAHENWYLVYYDGDVMILHVCAFTVEVQSFDALTVVFVRDGYALTTEKAKEIWETARRILGNKFGSLVPV